MVVIAVNTGAKACVGLLPFAAMTTIYDGGVEMYAYEGHSRAEVAISEPVTEQLMVSSPMF